MSRHIQVQAKKGRESVKKTIREEDQIGAERREEKAQ